METTEATDSLINPSLRALLHDVVDYAGLFPPAHLPLDDALYNYGEYRGEPEAWMLGRFVIPVRTLDDLAPYSGRFKKDDEPFAFSVLGTGGKTQEEFLAAFESDLEMIDAFDAYHGGAAQADVMEVPLPASLHDATASQIESFLDAVDQALVRSGTAKLDIFYELPLGDDTASIFDAFTTAAAECNSRQPLPARSEVGAKIRCGGTEPEAFPSTAAVATAITACRDALVPMKATAGLHHPVRHRDDDMGVMRHGFFNVFGAAALATEHDLDRSTVRAVLDEEIADNFRFLKEAFAWRDLTVPIDGVDYARENVITSFGSCSFEEPIDDLRDLDLM